MKQTRMFCYECKREWLVPRASYMNSAPVTITGNWGNSNCHICGSPEIEQIVYEPAFPGGDIPRAYRAPDSESNKPIEVSEDRNEIFYGE